MAWIESHSTLIEHKKVREVARLLNIKPVVMVGHLTCFWHKVIELREDGDISQWSEEDISYYSKWEGDPKLFYQALKNRFIDEKKAKKGDLRLVHNWLKYAWRYLFTKYHTANPKLLEQIKKKYKIKGVPKGQPKSQPKSQPLGCPPNLPNLTKPNQKIKPSGKPDSSYPQSYPQNPQQKSKKQIQNEQIEYTSLKWKQIFGEELTPSQVMLLTFGSQKNKVHGFKSFEALWVWMGDCGISKRKFEKSAFLYAKELARDYAGVKAYILRAWGPEKDAVLLRDVFEEIKFIRGKKGNA